MARMVRMVRQNNLEVAKIEGDLSPPCNYLTSLAFRSIYTQWMQDHSRLSKYVDVRIWVQKRLRDHVLQSSLRKDKSGAQMIPDARSALWADIQSIAAPQSPNTEGLKVDRCGGLCGKRRLNALT